jgi:hypothetical protein
VVNSIGIDISEGRDKLLESQLLNIESRVAMSIVFGHLQVLRMNVCVPLPLPSHQQTYNTEATCGVYRKHHSSPLPHAEDLCHNHGRGILAE